MIKSIIKGIYLVIIFLASLFLVSHFINRGNTDMTMEMGKATFPIVYTVLDGNQINAMHGYSQEMESAYIRHTITPLTNGRGITVAVDKYDSQIHGMSFEVRSIDGSRLIEDTEITDYTEQGDRISASFNLKDLIDTNTEYTLVLLITLENGNTIRYYTRVIYPEEYHVEEKIEFIKDFHKKTFDKEAAKDLTKYLESNSEGDNTTYSKVTIHSSFNQITWGDLAVTRQAEPQISIVELGEQTGSFRVQYYISLEEGREKQYYAVEEFYRIRYTSDRTYLLDYERSMDQIFDEKTAVMANNKIMLGITSQEVQLVESDGDNVFAFVNNNRLYSYNVADNKLAFLFGFYNQDNTDIRNVYDRHEIKILNVDEAGNVVYMVCGYMNRGRHEGSVGISVYQYDSTVNTVEEMVYLPSTKSEDLLIAEVEQLSYINRTGILYVMVNNSIYAINLETRDYEVVASALQENCYQVSESNRMLVWQKEKEPYQGSQLILMNLNTGNQVEINAKSDEFITPIGFIGEDLLYGIAKRDDITLDNTGNIVFPMYTVKIQNEVSGVLKEYTQENVYVTDGEIGGNQITLHRVEKTEDGSYEETADDQIMNAELETASTNYVETVATENLEKVVQIVVKDDINTAGLLVLTPKEVLFEGGRMMLLSDTDMAYERYYVYDKTGISGIFMSAGRAVKLANDTAGVVLNDSGNYVWVKGNNSIRNQIMAIKEDTATEERSSLAVCLDTILSYEGISRNSEYMLSTGETVLSILQDNMENTTILDLTGCSLDSVLYYVGQDIPVLVTLQDGEAVLLIGYNELNTVLMNPITGTIYKMGMEDSTTWFEENGNCFITYIRK